MNCNTRAYLCAFLLFPSLANAESRPLILEGDLSLGQISRDGSAVNSSGAPLAEIENVTTFALGGMAAYLFAHNAVVQLEFDIEGTDYPSSVDGEDANDTYDASRSLSLQAGYQLNQTYFGGFAGFGQVDSSDPEGDQDADYTVVGATARWASGDWTIAGQLGVLDSEAEDPETPADTRFGRVIGQRFFNEGQTKLQLDLAYAEGEQDPDDDPADDIKFRRLGLEVEQMMGVDLMGGNTSVYGAVYHFEAEEASDGGDTETARDTGLTLGLRIRFGANSLQDRAHGTAPDLPDVARWIGATPVLD